MTTIILDPLLEKKQYDKKFDKLENQHNLNFNNKELYYSSYEYIDNLTNETTSNQFINTFLTAYNYHLPLKIRPDDIHLSLQLIFSTYINNNAEQLKDMFSEHLGKINLEIESQIFDMSYFCEKFKELINSNLKNKEFFSMFTQNYSTSNVISKTVSNIMLMNTLKEYCSFEMILSCGIPYVILDGTNEDWNKLHEFYKYMKTLFIDSELNNWFTHFDIIMNMFMEMKFFENNTDVLIKIKKLWERVISYVPQGSGDDTILGGWVRLFVPYSFQNKLINFPKSIDCLDVNIDIPSKSKLNSYDCYHYQDILKKYYIAEGWNSIPYGSVNTEAILSTCEEKYEIEINSGFFNPHITNENIVCFNIGYNIKENKNIIIEEKKKYYLENGVIKRDCFLLDIPRKFKSDKNDILKYFGYRGYSFYGNDSDIQSERKKFFYNNGLYIEKSKWIERYIAPIKLKDYESELKELFEIHSIKFI